MAILTGTKFHFNWLMVTFLASGPLSPPRAWGTTEKAGPDRVKKPSVLILDPDVFK